MKIKLRKLKRKEIIKNNKRIAYMLFNDYRTPFVVNYYAKLYDIESKHIKLCFCLETTIISLLTPFFNILERVFTKEEYIKEMELRDPIFIRDKKLNNLLND